MSWIPYAILAKKSLEAAIRYDEQQSARFRCRICRTKNHTTEEHQNPQLNAKRQSELKECQIALPFLLAVLVGMFCYLLRIGWVQTVVVLLISWPFWVWAIAYRFREEQRKENERMYERQG